MNLPYRSDQARGTRPAVGREPNRSGAPARRLSVGAPGAGGRLSAPGVMAAVVVSVSLALVGPLQAQTVQGRVLQSPPGTPIAGALVVLQDSGETDLARTASSASGGYALAAGRAGRFTLVVRQIGWRTWRSPPFDLAAGQSYSLTVRVEAETYTLPTITVEARRPNCSVRLGDDEVVSRLLEVGQTAMALAQGAADGGALGFSSEWYLARYSPTAELVDSGGTGAGLLASWPIQSAPPDTLARWGFVRTDQPGQHWTDVGIDRGPVYYGLDARALFSDWFLAEHCFRVADTRGNDVLVAFTPERRGGRADVRGTLTLDRRTLELRRIAFDYVHLPRWIPAGGAGGAGGEVRVRRLRSGAWVPYAWRLRAPVARVSLGSPGPKLGGWVETGGRVVSVHGPSGEVDSAMTLELRAGPEPR
jgi:hypothetical protein